jgi:Ca-activated chloride channel family protein
MEGKFDVLEALTAIYDSLAVALEKLPDGRHDKRAILLITDGQDTWSRETPVTLAKRLGRSEVLVYGLGIPPSRPPDPAVRPPSASRDNVNMKTLWQFADSSGGRAILLSTDDPKRLDQLLSDIATELRNQYTLAYYPSIPQDGQFHKITVKTGDYVVRARNGYYN